MSKIEFHSIILKIDSFHFQSLLSPPTTNIQPLPEYKTAVAHKPRWIVSHYGALKVSLSIV